MNPERWADITRSFGLTGIDTPEPIRLDKLQTREEKDVPQSRESDLSHANYHQVKQTNSDGTKVHSERPLERFQDVSSCQDLSRNCEISERSITGDDVPGKIIENLCKIVREKSEKIKLQDKVIQSLHEKLEGRGLTAIVDKGQDAIDIDGESKPEVKAVDTDTESISLKKIAHKIESIERRLDTVINFIQRKYPKDGFGSSANPRTKKGESFFSHAWDKPPTVYPKPTYGSLIREMHCRHRFSSNDIVDKTSESEHFRGRSCNDLARRHVNFPIPKMPREEDNLVEMRIQALERLVVLLKGKLMKRINARRRK